MKLLIVLLFAVFAFSGSFLPAQDEKEFETWMKTTNSTMGSLRKNIQGKATDEAVKDAQKLEEIYKQVSAYFEKQKVEDAAKWAKEGQTAASEAAAAAKAGDWDKAATSARAINGTCNSCHGAHREKLPDGGYKFK